VKLTRRNLLLAAPFACAAAAPLRDKPVELLTSDKRLLAGFEWARTQALAFAFEDDPVGLWYEAALPGREAFCMRDLSHQAAGAHALGLWRHTRNMLLCFAKAISESKDWCSYWEINRYGRPAPVDYANDAAFWYNLPANFDLLDCCYRMYLLTGDLDYISDPAFLNFYDRTVNDYTDRWSLNLPRIMKRDRLMNISGPADPPSRFQRARGIPGYEEGRADFVLGADLLAAQYAAYQSYADIQDLRGLVPLSRAFRERAEGVSKLVNQTWWNEEAKAFRGFLTPARTLDGQSDAMMLYWGVAEPGDKSRAAAQSMVRRIKEHPSGQVEVQSHHAEILYRFGEPEVAYEQMMDLCRPDRARRDYPEVSYSVIGAIVSGLMGLTVAAHPASSAAQEGGFVDRSVRTFPSLGAATQWAEIRGYRLRANSISLRHDGRTRSALRNESGPSLQWRATLDGAHKTLLVNGEARPARLERTAGLGDRSFVTTTVAPGNTTTVAVAS
jgi:hypothetical protein